jgi:hypothetical protein
MTRVLICLSPFASRPARALTQNLALEFRLNGKMKSERPLSGNQAADFESPRLLWGYSGSIDARRNVFAGVGGDRVELWECRRSPRPKYISVVLWRRSMSQQTKMPYRTCRPPSRRRSICDTRTSVPLNGNVSSEYSGSLAYLISRLLGGYDYVIAHDQGTIEIVVSGKHSEAPTQVQAAVTAPRPQAVAAPGRRVGGVSADPRTYSTCMTFFRDQADCAEMMRRLNGSSH